MLYKTKSERRKYVVRFYTSAVNKKVINITYISLFIFVKKKQSLKIIITYTRLAAISATHIKLKLVILSISSFFTWRNYIGLNSALYTWFSTPLIDNEWNVMLLLNLSQYSSFLHTLKNYLICIQNVFVNFILKIPYLLFDNSSVVLELNTSSDAFDF